ncbi:MAG TPA: response regulator [Terriglobales bacterium]|nr:response regulator [Terriglobales bacterium]
MLQCLSIRRALVVDDSMLIRHTVRRLLEKYGFEVESASNGLDALRVLSRLRPSVIFTDLEMPKMNGHQLIGSLKSKAETFDIPIVVLSAKRSPDEPRADICMKKEADIHAELLKVLELTLTPENAYSAGS